MASLPQPDNRLYLGRGGSGKSTLARRHSDRFDRVLLVMPDESERVAGSWRFTRDRRELVERCAARAGASRSPPSSTSISGSGSMKRRGTRASVSSSGRRSDATSSADRSKAPCLSPSICGWPDDIGGCGCLLAASAPLPFVQIFERTYPARASSTAPRRTTCNGIAPGRARSGRTD